MASRDDMIRELKRRDMIKQLKERDAASEGSEEADLREKAFAPLPSLRELEKARTPAWQSTAQGLASSMAGGLDDEIAGVASGVKAAATLNNPITAYEQTQAAVDDKKKLIQEANPGASLVGTVGGSVIGPGIMAKAGSGLLKTMGVGAGVSAGTGAVNRASDTTGMDRITDAVNPKAIAQDAALGSVFGAGGYALGNSARAAKAATDKLKPAAEIAGRVTGAAKEGAKDAGVLGTFTGPAAAVKEVLSIGRDAVQDKKIANQFRKHIGPGASKDMTDPEVIALMVLEKDPTAIAYVANRASASTGAPADEFKALLTAGTEARGRARSFDFDGAGENLARDFDDVGSELNKAASGRVNELNTAARGRFDPQQADPGSAITALDGLVAKGREHPGTVGNVSYIEAASNILKNGSGTIKGLTKASWDAVDNQEMYDRLQTARRYLGENVKFSKQSGLSQAAQESQDAYHAIGKVLKFDPDKMESDAVWSGFKKLEEGLLDQLQVNGKVDKYKVGGMLKDTVTAKRFRDNLEMLDEFSNRPGLSPEMQAKVVEFRDKFAKQLNTAELRRTLQKFESDTVGSSRSGRAAQSAESLKRGDNPLTEMFKAPEQSLRTSEHAVARAESVMGKSFADMSPEERKQIVRFQTALKKNPNLDFAETYHTWLDSAPKSRK